MILYLTSRADLNAISSDRTISLPASVLEQRQPFEGAAEIAKRIHDGRRSETTRIYPR
jgi:hypothetical protein